MAEIQFVADLIESIPLSIRDRYTFVTAPCPTRNVECTNAFKFMVKCFSEKETCQLDDLVSMPNKAPATMDGLNRLESSHKVILLYMWLRYEWQKLNVTRPVLDLFHSTCSLRFPETFTTSQERGLELKSTCEELIDQALKEYGADMERRHRKRLKRQRQSDTKKLRKWALALLHGFNKMMHNRSFPFLMYLWNNTYIRIAKPTSWRSTAQVEEHSDRWCNGNFGWYKKKVYI